VYLYTFILTRLKKDATKLIKTQKEIDHQVTRVWTDLSSFEESSANCISDMLLNVAAGAYKEGIRMVNQFIMHLEVLFSALDLLQQHYVTSQNQGIFFLLLIIMI
jgi:hypothetical protein